MFPKCAKEKRALDVGESMNVENVVREWGKSAVIVEVITAYHIGGVKCSKKRWR